MGRRSQSNVLLVEILIAVLFFMLSATVLVQVFAASRSMTVRADAQTRALAEAQNTAEALGAAEDVEELLAEEGFLKSHGVWTKEFDTYTLYVSCETVPEGPGEMRSAQVRAFYKNRKPQAGPAGDEEMFSLPVVRYQGVNG